MERPLPITRTPLTTVGSGLATAVLLAGGLLVAGAGSLLAVFLGLAAGTALGAVVFQTFEESDQSIQRVVSGYAAFGIVFSVLFIVGTVVPGADSYLFTEALVGAGLLAAAVVHGLYYTAEVKTV